MSIINLEKRLAALEEQMAELRAIVRNGNHSKNWEQTIGMFAGDEVMKRITDAALEYREKDRAKARARYSKKRRTAK